MSRRRLVPFLLIAAACVGCDQASKLVAGSWLDGAPVLSLARDTLRLELVSNPGGFLSLGARLPDALRQVVFIALVPLALAWICSHVLRSSGTSRRSVVALGLVAGGGLGNWLDRLLHGGAVTDFVSLGAGPLRTGVFNLADVAVVAGIALLLLPAPTHGGPPGGAEGGDARRGPG